jgi:hypothetical protein
VVAVTWLEFFAATAWPIAVVLLGLLFRRPLTELVANLRHLKVGSLEVFRDLPQLPPTPQVPQLPAGAEVPPELTLAPPAPVPVDDLARESSIGAVIAAWVRLEEAVYRAVARLGLESQGGPTRSIPSLLERLRKAGALDGETLSAMLKVREIRNRVVHLVGEAPALEQADDYRDVVDELMRRLITGTEDIRLAALLKELHVDNALHVTVGPLAAIGVSASVDAAREVALSRQSKWGANSSGVRMVVSQEDAALLLRRGARYEPGLVD